MAFFKKKEPKVPSPAAKPLEKESEKLSDAGSELLRLIAETKAALRERGVEET